MIKSLAALVVLASGAHAQVRIAPIQTVGSMAIGGALTGPMTSGNLTAVSVQPLASTVSGVMPSAPALTPSAPVAAPIQTAVSATAKTSVTTTPDISRRSQLMAAKADEIAAALAPSHKANYYGRPLSIGEDVVSAFGFFAQVVGFFPNGDVEIQFESGARYTVTPDSLARKYGIVDGVYAGEQVITAQTDYAQVVGVYPNGDVAVQKWHGWMYEGPVFTYPARSVARRYGSLGDITVGDKVFTADHQDAQVVGIYRNGNVALAYWNGDAYAGVHIRKADTLARR